MSRARVCDQCGTAVTVDRHGEDADGETASWLVVETADGSRFDLCTRSCAEQLLADEDFVKAMDAYAEPIVEVARVIREDREDADDGDAE